MNIVRIGIDPGLNGAIVINNNNTLSAHPLPILGKELNIQALNELLYTYQNQQNIITAIEDVHAIFGAAASATFKFGFICGVIEGTLGALKIPYIKIQPKLWQKEMWQGIHEIRKPNRIDKNGKTHKGQLDTKKMSLVAAQRLFPTFPLTKPNSNSTKIHDGIVDALLICEYARRKC